MNDSELTVVWDCDTREAAIKLLLELKLLGRKIDGVYLKLASLDEDWSQWLQPVDKQDAKGVEKK